MKVKAVHEILDGEGKTRKAGEIFECSPNDGEYLIEQGMAEAVEEDDSTGD